ERDFLTKTVLVVAVAGRSTTAIPTPPPHALFTTLSSLIQHHTLLFHHQPAVKKLLGLLPERGSTKIPPPGTQWSNGEGRPSHYVALPHSRIGTREGGFRREETTGVNNTQIFDFILSLKLEGSMANPPIVPSPLNVELHPACSLLLERGCLGPSKVGKKELEAMVKNGKIPSMDVVRHSEGEDHPRPHDDEVVVFELYFDLGLGIPSVQLLEGILQLFHVELPHLSPSAILRLAVYEWAMRAESAEGLAEHFAALHSAFCQPRFIKNEKKTKKLAVVHFGCINFQLRGGKGSRPNKYKLEFPAWASNYRWPIGWVNNWFYYNVGKGSSLHSTNRDIGYVKEPSVVAKEDARTLLRKVTTMMGMRDLVEEYTMLKVCPLARGWSQIHKFERGEEEQLGLYKGHAKIDSAPDVSILTVEDAIKKVEDVLGKPSLQECKAREARTGKWERKNRICDFFGFQIPEAVDMKKLEELEEQELAEKENRTKKKGLWKKRGLGSHGDSQEGSNKRRKKGKGKKGP
ncbi:hypothetical protein EJB05_57256, partial [Eragrostis curvula]